MPCLGNADKPCCWIKGKLCPYVREDDPRAPERRWACGLYLEHRDRMQPVNESNGSSRKVWDAVLNDPRYKKNVEGSWKDNLNCRDWPDGEGANQGTCKECGVNV